MDEHRSHNRDGRKSHRHRKDRKDREDRESRDGRKHRDSNRDRRVGLKAQHGGCGCGNADLCPPSINWRAIREILLNLPGVYQLTDVQRSAGMAVRNFQGLAAITREQMSFTVTDNAFQGTNPVGTPDIWSFFTTYNIPNRLLNNLSNLNRLDGFDGFNDFNNFNSFTDLNGDGFNDFGFNGLGSLLNFFFINSTYIRHNSSLANPTIFREIGRTVANLTFNNGRLIITARPGFPITSMVLTNGRISTTTADGGCFVWTKVNN